MLPEIRIKMDKLFYLPGASGSQQPVFCSALLRRAAQNGDRSAIVNLLERHPGPSVDEPDLKGLTALHLAASHRHAECVRLLLEAGASPSAEDSGGRSPMHLAVESGAELEYDDIITGVRILMDHVAPQHRASQQYDKCVQCVQALLDHGASVHAQDGQGQTPLHIAAKVGWPLVAAYLLERGASAKAVDQGMRTPLHEAVSSGCANTADVLLQAGADASAATLQGYTALALAAQHGHISCVTTLAKHNADMDARDSNGDTVLHVIAAQRPSNAAKFVQAVIRAGGSPNVANAAGSTPLHIAVAQDDFHLAVALVKEGADINAVDSDGRTALHLSVERGSPKLAALLLENRAALSATGRSKGTPLHIAAEEGHADLVATLLAAGADASAVEPRSRWTPLHCAAWRGRGECASLLLVCGADLEARDTDYNSALQLAEKGDFPHVVALLKDAAVRPVEEEVKLQPDITHLYTGKEAIKAAGKRLLDGSRQRAEMETAVMTMVRLNAEGKVVGPLSRGGAAASNSHSNRAGAPRVDLAPLRLQFDQLKLERELGQGSFGQVFLATLNRVPVAVKVLRVRSATTEDLMVELIQEAGIMMMAESDHDNIVELHGVVYFPPCIVTEYCPRGSLFDVLWAAMRDPGLAIKLDWPRRLNMAMDAAMGMLCLHNNDPVIIHRDLKAANLLVTSEYRVKVADFNLSKLILDTSMSITTAGGPQNPRWLAPEVLRGSKATLASDVFSFGVVLWELLTWEVPWAHEEHYAVLHQVIAGKRPPIPSVDRLPGPGLPEFAESGELEVYIELMKSCWHQEEEERLPFDDVAWVLRGMLKRLAGTAPRPHEQEAAAEAGPGFNVAQQSAASMPPLEPIPQVGAGSGVQERPASMPALQSASQMGSVPIEAGGPGSAIHQHEPQAAAATLQEADQGAAQLAGNKRALPPSLLSAIRSSELMYRTGRRARNA